MVSYPNFSSTDGLTLNGNAVKAGSFLRLTPNATSKRGSAFLTNTVSLPSSGFSTSFRFAIPNSGGDQDDDGWGADGIVFVVQAQGNTALGGFGGNIGYSGITPSVGVEFDTWYNGWDPSIDRTWPWPDIEDGNHVGINQNGSVTSLVTKKVGTRMNNGAAWYAWIDYNGSTLEVRLSTGSSRPGPPFLTRNINLSSVLGTNSVYVGFTAATGAAYSTHYILSWEFKTNGPPTADAGADQPDVEQDTPGGATVTLDGSGSTDDGLVGPLTYTWADANGELGTGVYLIHEFPLGGPYTVTLTVDDGEFTDTDTVDITVVDTTPPDLVAPDDIVVEQTSAEGAEVSIEDALATDICDPAPAVSHDGPVDGIYPLGDTLVTFTATDASSNSIQVSMVVSVIDTTLPVITLKGDVAVLLEEGIWPPNHKYHTITIADLVESVWDLCDAGISIDDVMITCVSSDEPENDIGDGDGDTWEDIVIADDQRSVDLRSERQGISNGRVYTIEFGVADLSGNIATDSAQVSVPHDKNVPAVDGPGSGYTECYP
ncbi:PKD domain-containing protein [Candidatus Poribacteria bacterium]